MNWLQAISSKIPQHKYAIQAKQLGDQSTLPWTNLGYWNQTGQTYPEACQQLAEQLAQAVHLNQEDHLLDLGCGQGASLKYWLSHYGVRHITAVDIQAACVQKIQTALSDQVSIHQASFLQLNTIFHTAAFNAVVCVDAAYHSPLHEFLAAVHHVLKPGGRMAFHYLMFSEKWQHLSVLQQKKYQLVLRAADVQIQHLSDLQGTMQQCTDAGFTELKLQDLSVEVLCGFADYVQHQNLHLYGLDGFKIRMTAKLCRKLFEDGLVRYVQMSAVKKAE